jgi:hypothetical protein
VEESIYQNKKENRKNYWRGFDKKNCFCQKKTQECIKSQKIVFIKRINNEFASILGNEEVF